MRDLGFDKSRFLGYNVYVSVFPLRRTTIFTHTVTETDMREGAEALVGKTVNTGIGNFAINIKTPQERSPVRSS